MARKNKRIPVVIQPLDLDELLSPVRRGDNESDMTRDPRGAAAR